jgi:hypothetical protein
MDFITWWFDEHWVWSTLLTPAITFAWCCFKGEVVRGIVAFGLTGFITLGSTARRS